MYFLILSSKGYLYCLVLLRILAVFYGIYIGLRGSILSSPVRRKAGKSEATRLIRGRAASFFFGPGRSSERGGRRRWR